MDKDPSSASGRSAEAPGTRIRDVKQHMTEQSSRQQLDSIGPSKSEAAEAFDTGQSVQSDITAATNLH